MLNKNDRKAGTLYRIIWKINGGGKKNHGKEPLTHRGYFPECIFPLVQPQVVSQGLHKLCSKPSPHVEANRATFTTFLQGTLW